MAKSDGQTLPLRKLTYSHLTCEGDKDNQISLRRKNHGVNGGL